MSLTSARRVLAIETRELERLAARLDERFEQAMKLCLECRGRVVVAGMGKSGLIGRKISATLASTGTPSFFLHPAEAQHGDLGMVTPEDVILAISYSGESEEIIALLEAFRRLGCKLITMTGNAASTLAQASDVVLDISVQEEACALNLAPTASTTVTLALGDALAVAVYEQRGFQPDDFARLHPAGRLGKSLRRVVQLMHKGEDVPSVPETAAIPDVIYEISRKGLGMAAVVDGGGKLAGIITDGDLRRLMQKMGPELFHRTAADCMTRHPMTIAPGELAGSALRLMEQKKITSLVVVDEARQVQGVVHLHDLWTLQLF